MTSVRQMHSRQWHSLDMFGDTADQPLELKIQNPKMFICLVGNVETELGLDGAGEALSP